MYKECHNGKCIIGFIKLIILCNHIISNFCISADLLIVGCGMIQLIKKS